MSNQEYRCFLHKKPNPRDSFNESFQFILNSCYKLEGRSIIFRVWDKFLFGDKVFALGILDIDPILYGEGKVLMQSRLRKSKYNEG